MNDIISHYESETSTKHTKKSIPEQRSPHCLNEYFKSDKTNVINAKKKKKKLA